MFTGPAATGGYKALGGVSGSNFCPFDKQHVTTGSSTMAIPV